MSVRDSFPTPFLVAGKEAIALIYTACLIGNDGLRCIFYTVETNLQGRRYEDFSEAR